MAQQIINVGSAPNDGTGDPLRTAYIKTNNNFTELYSRAQTNPPASLTGALGDVAGMYAYDQNYFYYCFADFDGSSVIWNQVSQIGNVSVTQLASGTSSVSIPAPNGNINLNPTGISNVAVVWTDGVSVTGNLTSSNNITGGNLFATGLIEAVGTITGSYFVGNGAFLTGINAVSTYGNANVSAFLSLTGTSNVLPVANVAYSLGSPTRQWKDLYISNATIYMNSVPITIGSGNILQVNGQSVVTSSGSGAITTTGNVAAGNVTTTGVISSTGNITTSGNISATGNISGGNISVGRVTATGNITTTGLVSATGNVSGANLVASANVIAVNISGANVSASANITAVGNISGNYILGNGSQLTGIPASYGDANVAAYLPTFLPTYSGNLSGGNVIQNGVRAYKYTVANTAPTNPVPGDNWWYQAGNVMYQYINDGTSSQWVDVFDPDYPPTSTSASANTIVQRDASSNITANAFIGDGSLLTGVVSTVSTLSSANLTYAAPYTGSFIRSGQAKYADVISVKDFGALGNGSNNDTTAIQAAIDAANAAGGAQVYFPAGTYVINSALNMSGNATTLVGESRYGTTIQQSTMNAKILNISGSYCGVKGLSFLYNGTPVNGGTAIYVTSGYVTLNDFVVRNAYIGVYFYGASAVAGKVSQFEIFDYESVGLQCESLNDVFVSQFIINAGNTTRGALGGIRLYNKVEAFICTDGDILLGTYSITTDAASNSVGVRPAYNNFTNVYFDSAANGALFDKMVETEIVGCWFSGGRDGSGAPGLVVANCDSLRFTNTRWDNNGTNGCVVNSTSVRTVFTACKFEGNGVTATGDGLQIAANTSNFQILGCQAHNGLIGGTQRYGINVGSGCDNFIVANNITLSGGSSGGIINSAGTGATKIVSNNL